MGAAAGGDAFDGQCGSGVGEAIRQRGALAVWIGDTHRDWASGVYGRGHDKGCGCDGGDGCRGTAKGDGGAADKVASTDSDLGATGRGAGVRRDAGDGGRGARYRDRHR